MTPSSSAAPHWQPSAPRLPLRRTYPGLALAAAAFLALLAGCQAKPAPAGPPPALPVSVLTVEPTNVPLTGQWVGTLDGFVNANIQPQVSGYLIRQDYKEGLPVAKGQVLFQIDPRPFQALVDQAQAQVAQAHGQVSQAQAQLGLTQINVTRDTPLAQARAIAQSQLDNDTQQQAQAKASVSAAQAGVAAAQAQLATARLNLGFTQVRSLIAGVAGQAQTQVGNLVGPQTVLTSVSQLDPIKVFFSLSDAEYLALTQRAQSGHDGGQSDLLHGARSIPLTLTLADGEVFPHTGRIAFVDRSLNAQTGAIRIAAVFPNPGNVLRPGQFGRVSAETEVRHNVILVPQSAVQELQGIEQVYTVAPGNKVHVVNVTLGPQSGNSWIISGGLAPGTQIITDNLQKLREGAPVAPHDAPPTPAIVSTAGDPAGR